MSSGRTDAGEQRPGDDAAFRGAAPGAAGVGATGVGGHRDGVGAGPKASLQCVGEHQVRPLGVSVGRGGVIGAPRPVGIGRACVCHQVKTPGIRPTAVREPQIRGDDQPCYSARERPSPTPNRPAETSRARQVEPGLPRRRAGPEQHDAAHDGESREDEVDVQGPAPVEVLGEETAQQQAQPDDGLAQRGTFHRR